MLTIFYSTRKENFLFEEHLDLACELDSTEIVEFVNPGAYSLAEVYNIAIKQCTTPYLLLIHDDIVLERGFDKKIVDYFKKFPNYGVLGLAGTPVLSKSGIWWEQRHLMCGQVYHQQGKGKEKKTWLSKYSESFEGEIMECAVVDGLFMALNLKNIKQEFDESISGFHYYDIAFCLRNAVEGVKIGVISDLKIIHKSIGNTPPEWHLNKNTFLNKYGDKLPFNVIPHIIYDDKPVELTREPKIAIIIPTKNNSEILERCLKSFEKTNYKNYKIYIADTGSDIEELEKIKNLPYEFELLEYDWYNFAKINNDVVSKIEDTELLLFCNDDIQLINDAISNMVDVWLKNKNVGTVGGRLHYDNGLIQHGGILFYYQDKMIKVTHRAIKTFYGSGNEIINVIGNTGAFMLVSKEVFEQVGGFPHTNECFEDLAMNTQLIIQGKKNIYCGKAVCLHSESVSRKRNENKIKEEAKDYETHIIPLLEQHFKTLKKYILNFGKN